MGTSTLFHQRSEYGGDTFFFFYFLIIDDSESFIKSFSFLGKLISFKSRMEIAGISSFQISFPFPVFEKSCESPSARAHKFRALFKNVVLFSLIIVLRVPSSLN